MSDNFDIVTFGCRLNIFETSLIRENLQKTHLQNVTIINSCSVTNEAKNSVKKTIRKLKKISPDKKIFVTGCAAQKDPLEFAQMTEVDKVIGNNEKFDPRYYLDSEDNIHVADTRNIKDKIFVSNIMDVKHITPTLLLDNLHNKTRAFMQIQNGCDHRCTFCIIPFARGNSRSVPLNTILLQISHFLAHGYKEIIFTGVDISSYGDDLDVKLSLVDLIRRVLINFPQLERLRLSSIDIAEINDDLFHLIANEKRIMPHLHISLQAGNDIILKRMKRRHRRMDIIKFCQNLRTYRPNFALGADIIAGFPTESDEMFEQTKNLISEAQIQYLHVFPYSMQEGTPAAQMPQVPRDIIKKRVSLLIQEGKKQEQIFMRNFIGKKSKILVENNAISHTEHFIPVKLEQDLVQKYSGSILEMILAKSSSPNYLYAYVAPNGSK